MGRIIIFTGKGGVGKTGLSIAHAFASAREGKRTLLVSTDMAHSLGDALEQRLGDEIVTLYPNMDVLELNPSRIMREEYAEVVDAISDLLTPDGMHLDYAKELPSVLGLEDLFSLLKIEKLYRSGEYERVIVDCAPTGETLALLKLPELLSWYVDKLFPVGEAALGILGPVSEKLFHVKLPDASAMKDVRRLYDKLLTLQALLKNPEVTSVRIVCTPERMVVEETKRSYMYLKLYHFCVDGIYINRVLPKELDNPFMEAWGKIQEVYLTELQQIFAELPIVQIPWYPNELRGISAIEAFCKDNLSGKNLFETKKIKNFEVYETLDCGYCLHLRIPGVEEAEVEVRKQGQDLMVKVNQLIRCIPLPNQLRHGKVIRTESVEGELRILFESEKKDIS